MLRAALAGTALAILAAALPAGAQRGPEIRDVGPWRVEVDRSIPPVNQCTLRLSRPGPDGLRFAVGYDRGERAPWLRLSHPNWRLRARQEGQLELVFALGAESATWRTPFSALDRTDIAAMLHIPAEDQAEFWSDLRAATRLRVRVVGTGEYVVDLSAYGPAADIFSACRAEAESAGPIPGMPRLR
jgi:hypothetical protein